MFQKKSCFKVLYTIFLAVILLPSLLSFELASHTLEARADTSNSWFYDGWHYRKEHDILYTQTRNATNFYDFSDPLITIAGNPVGRHTFQPVHNTTIVECNIVIDGATRKYLAYDSDPAGSEIRLYYTDNLDGQWMQYSGNPILSGYLQFRWPSVAYVNGVFHMFLTDRTNLSLERWTSTDGIHYSFAETIKVGGSQWKSPFIWFNPNDNKWYLYTHDATGSLEHVKVRSATSIEDLDSASDTIVLSVAAPFGAASVMYFNNTYWLVAELLEGGIWQVVAYSSTTSPSSGYSLVANSPILTDNEACPILLLTQDQNSAYLYTNKDSAFWYQYTRKVYLNSTIFFLEAPTLTNYQVKIKAYYGSGFDAGESVFLNTHSRIDFGDVRFTWLNSSSGLEQECSYWIEELNAGESAVFWIEIPAINSMINNKIYVYYGNTSATTTSNATATFDLFDDFEEDLTDWAIIYYDGTGTASVVDGWARINAQPNGDFWAFKDDASGLFKANPVDNNYVIETCFRQQSYPTSDAHNRFLLSRASLESSSAFYSILFDDDSSHITTCWRDSTGAYTGWAGENTGWSRSAQTTLYARIAKIGSTFYAYISPDGNTWFLVGSRSGKYHGYIGLVDSYHDGYTEFDWVRVRKYIDPGPTHEAWGNEEEVEAPPAPSISVSGIGVNSTIAAKPCNFSAIFTAQNSNLSHYIFGTNNTGRWINDTAISFGKGKSQAIASIVKTLNNTIGVTIQWQIWANNTAGNWASTGIQVITTSGNLSTVATLPIYGYTAIEYACQRKTFYANGRFWVFYYDGASSAGYSTSTDGFTWTLFTPFTSRECGAGWRFAIALNGTHLHYVFSTGVNGDPLYYRCGLPNADGTITWLDNEQNITVSEINTGHLWPSIAIDSEGRPWVAYARKNETENSRYAYVTTSSTSNGTWITAPEFPHRLSSTNYTGINVMILPLTNQKMFAIVSCGGWQIESYLWTGSSWSEKQITTSAITSDGIIECGLSAVNQGDDVHLTFVKDSTHDLIYTRYSYASNSWGPETIVHPAVTSQTSPVLSIDIATNTLYCFWAGAPTADCIYYKVYNSSAWTFVEGSNPWIIDKSLAGYYQYDGLSGFYQSYNNHIALAYTSGTHGSYQLKFAFLTTKVSKYVIIDQTLVSDGRANVNSVQTVSIHAKWNNGSNVIHGRIYVNGIEYITNDAGWIAFDATSTQVGRSEWDITAVNCDGITDFIQSVPNPYIIWDKLTITYSANPANPVVGQVVNFEVSAVYSYDNEKVIFSYINTYRNNTHYASEAFFTDTQNSEITFLYTAENASDNLYGITVFTSNTSIIRWQSLPQPDYVIIDYALVSDERADINSMQTVAFHAKWSGNNSDVMYGSIYVNGTEYITNSTGWAAFFVTSPQVGKHKWSVTTVNCGGITNYVQTVQDPAIIWDKLVITYSASSTSPKAGQVVNFSVSAVYAYNGESVTFSYINTYRNNSHHASGNSFMDVQYNEVTYLYTAENTSDNIYQLTAFTSNTIIIHWTSLPPTDYVIIDAASVSDERADIGSVQTVAFHAKWGLNGSSVIQGNIYINGTPYVTNSTGWINLIATSQSVGRQEWTVTSVDCGGVTDYIQTAPNPSIIWDQIKITAGGKTKNSMIIGETVTIWFQAIYEYDNTFFDNAKGALYVNYSQMSWSTLNNRWEYQYTPETSGTKEFKVSDVLDNSYGLSRINDLAGPQTINVQAQTQQFPQFSIISNSTITELAFNSTTKIITFTVTGPTGTIGYINITIGKTLIENITELAIYLDGNPIEYTVTLTEYTWLIHFTYTQSTHKVTILLTALKTTIPSTNLITTTFHFTVILIVVTIIGLLASKKLVKEKNTNKKC